MNKTVEDIISRRSIRRYKSEQITREELDTVLRAGMAAPTAKNLQSPIIVAVQNKADIEYMSKLNAAVMGVSADPFYGAPTVLVVLADADNPNAVADGSLVMTYDDAALTCSGADGLVSLSAEGQTARLDVQELSGDLSRFTRAELERICKGVLQAYYFAAPATDDIALTDAQQTEDNFSAVLRAEAYEDAPAVTALVQLRQLNGKSWCVSAILPDGENTDAVRQAMDSVEPLPEGVTVEGAVQP